MHLRENRFEEAIELFYEAAAVPELWPGALQVLAEACGALGANLMSIGPGLEGYVSSPDIDGYMADFVASGWLTANSYMRRGMELTAAGWRGLITSRDMLTPEEAARDAYVNDHRIPAGLGAEAGMVIARAGSHAVIPLTIDRRSVDEPFTRLEVLRMNRLVTALRPGAELALRSRMSGTRGIAEGVAAGGVDVALLAPSGRVMQSTPGFEGRLGDGLAIRSGFLRSWHYDADRRLTAAVEQTIARVETARRVTQVVALPRRRARLPLIAQFVPITGTGQDIFQLARGAVLVTDPAEARPERGTTDFVGNALGLSPAEARLASRIGAGEDLKVIAESEGITIATARSRLKSVFAKTGTHRQVELAVLVAALHR